MRLVHQSRRMRYGRSNNVFVTQPRQPAAYFPSSIIGLFPLHINEAQTHGRAISLQRILHGEAQLTDISGSDRANSGLTYEHRYYLISIQRHKNPTDQLIPAFEHGTAGPLAGRHLRTLILMGLGVTLPKVRRPFIMEKTSPSTSARLYFRSHNCMLPNDDSNPSHAVRARWWTFVVKYWITGKRHL